MATRPPSPAYTGTFRMVGKPLARILKMLGQGKKGERAFFDPNFYRQTYLDIAAAGADPFQHFMQHGWREGRDPSPRFKTLFYRDFHLEGAAINPLSHYVASGGVASGLPTVPPTEADYVRLQRPIVAAFFDSAYYRPHATVGAQDLLGDYLTIGWKQGRAPSGDFDVTRYCGEFQFVKALGVSPLYHHASQMRLNGRQSSRPASKILKIQRATIEAVVAPAFDGVYYLRNNDDVRLAKLDPLAHFIDFGWRERRNPTALFDCRWYGANNEDVAAAGLNPFYHYLTIGRAEGRRGNPIGTRLHPAMLAPTAAEWERTTPAADTATADVVVIIPVYRGYDETLRAIHAVLVAGQTTRFALHVINDVTPDPGLETALTELAGKGLFSYSRNEVNLGFVKSCNRGLRRFADKQIVLLNADAQVFGDWLDRMVAHAARDPAIATITPLSNNATICSYPVINANNVVEPGMTAEALDRLAATCNRGRASEVPTGVGFCFYMSRASREAIGLFDEEAFGRGYGEENDFCLRAAKAGFRNVLAEDIFVYHAGEVSFASVVESEYGPGQKALHAKHPDYLTRIRHHIEADPGLVGRMRLDLYRLARGTGRDSIVFLSHALSGGIVTHVRHLENRLAEENTPVVHIRVGVSDRWSLVVAAGSSRPVFTPNLRAISFNQIRSLIEDFIGWLKPRAFHIHSLVGFDWTTTTGMLELVRQSRLPYYFTLHDYSVVCHRHNLVLTNGVYCGLPAVDVCKVCVATDRSYPEALDPAVRRQTFAAFLEGASGVFAPSRDIAMRLAAAGARYEIIERPHEEMTITPFEPVPPPELGEAMIDIVVIGAIGDHKGAAVILDLARDAKARSLPLRFHIVGFSNATEEMIALGVIETGPYKTDAEAVELVGAIRPAMILLPSIWPETFCFTLSLAFDIKVPPVVFDIGAQAERVRQAGFGFVLPYRLIDDIQALADRLRALPESDRAAWKPSRHTTYVSILADYYGMKAPGPGRQPLDGRLLLSR